MFENAMWVCFDGKAEAPLVRKEFSVHDVVSAQIDICGLGIFELYINGRKVSEDVLVPAWTEYEERNQKENYAMSHRIYYLNYDITEYLTEGQNALGIMLGNGWYNQYVHTIAGNMEYGKPKLCFSMCVKGRSGDVLLVSDRSLKWSAGYTYFNNIYYGDKQDLRRYDENWCKAGYDDSKWDNVIEIPAPKAYMEKQACPADRKIRELTPQLIAERGGIRVYDVGENISGWIRLVASGESGSKVIVRYAEECYEDGRLNFTTCGWKGQVQADEYISDGNGRCCEPHFSYHGFRYFELEGEAEDIRAVVVHADVPVTSRFRCDDAVINWLYDSYIRTQLSNMHMGVPSDCPHRERLGYTGDGQLASEAAMLLFDARQFYRKWINDIFDCQDVNTGHVHHTAPAYGTSGGGPGGWGCAIVVVPYHYYKFFGDRSVLVQAYPKMERWIAYMKTRSEDGLVVREEETGWCLGEWCTPDDVKIPEPYVNTYFLIKSLSYMKEIAGILDIPFTYDDLARQAREALIAAFYDKQSNSFAGSVQGSDAFALDLGLGNQEMMERLARRYDDNPSFDTGIFGTYILIKLLFARGYHDTAIKLLSSEREHTFGYMKNHNATTLWERWNGGAYHPEGNSHNHPMFGACVSRLFIDLLGFHIFDEQLEISPVMPKRLNRFEGSVKTARGSFAAAYEKTDEGFRATITIDTDERVIFRYGNTVMELARGSNVITI